MAERRKERAFEPPPWEREQFEDLAKRRAESGEGPGAIQTEPEKPAPTEKLEPVTAARSAATVGTEGKLAAVGVEEAQLVEMLSQLSVEEPSALAQYWRIGLLGSLISGAIGMMLLVLGTVGMAKTARAGVAGIMGGSILLVFGAGFLGVAAWMAVRTLKQRGVL